MTQLATNPCFMFKIAGWFLRLEALHLNQSYLSSRASAINILSTLSIPIQTSVGEPQGSIHSPLLFNCYMSQLPVPCTQFWVCVSPENEEIARLRIQ